MSNGKIAFVVGHANWGKSKTLRALTNDNYRVNRIMIGGVDFFIRRMSNDDQAEGYLNFMNDVHPAIKPNLIAALCPNFHEPEAATFSILTDLRSKGYQLFFWVIKHQFGTADAVTENQINRLSEFGMVEVFSKQVEASARSKAFKQFVLDVVLPSKTIAPTSSSKQRRRTIDSMLDEDAVLPTQNIETATWSATALTILPAAMDGFTEQSGDSKLLQIPEADLQSELLKDPRNVPVWFGTNRAPVNAQDFRQGFSSEWTGSTTLGRCIVNVPKGHVPGKTGSAWWIRLVKGDDRLNLISIESLPDFWNQMSNEMKKPREEGATNEALFFLHGYNVTFEQAAVRTAQLAYDLRIHPSAFFSWPSKGNVEDYSPDEATIEASYDAVSDFVKQFDICALEAGATLHVVAHSMGNRALLKALEAVSHGMDGGNKSAIDKLVFAAPDVDARVFMQSLEKIPLVGKRKTLYVSHRDKALWLSRSIYEYPRAGLLPPVTIAPGLDTIDATDVDNTFVGHDYFASVRALINDISSLFKGGLPPYDRVGIEPAEHSDGQKYWRIV
ncbi:MAG: alpha/beta hydrolase [Gallionella sp.]|nr:alpha/beta hydrolase [Gallionella sp.]